MDRRTVIAGLAVSGLARPVFAASVVVPFRSLRGRVFLPVRLGAIQALAMLDTGANASFVDAGLADALGGSSREITVTGAAGFDIPSRLLSDLPLQIGGETVDGLRFATVDLARSVTGFSEPVGVVLGASLLRRFVVEIDYETSRLTFTPSPEFDAPARPLALSLDAALGFIPLTIEGGRPLRANIDLGLDEPLTVNDETARRLRLLQRRRVSQGLRTSIEGAEIVDRASARRVAFAGRGFRNVPFSVWAFDRREAAIGAPLLSRFHLTYDLAQSRIWLRPNRDFAAPFHRDVFGWADDEEGRVTHVFAGGPAEKAGLRVGDRVVANDNPRVLRAADPPAGQPVGLTLEDGRKLILVTGEYY